MTEWSRPAFRHQDYFSHDGDGGTRGACWLAGCVYLFLPSPAAAAEIYWNTHGTCPLRPMAHTRASNNYVLSHTQTLTCCLRLRWEFSLDVPAKFSDGIIVCTLNHNKFTCFETNGKRMGTTTYFFWSSSIWRKFLRRFCFLLASDGTKVGHRNRLLHSVVFGRWSFRDNWLEF